MDRSTGEEASLVFGALDRVREIVRRLALESGPQPDTLHHYTDANGLIGILKTGSIWASSVAHLNDSRELKLAVGIAEEVSHELDGDGGDEWFGEFLGAFRAGLQSVLSRCVFVASLSGSFDDVNQWRAYTSPHAGFALAFHHERLRDRVKKHSMIVPCIYEHEKQRAAIREVLAGHRKHSEKATPKEVAGLAVGQVAYLAPLLKDGAFHTEAEWRIVVWTRFADQPVQLRGRSTGVVPYVAVNLAWENAPLPVTSICVGPSPRLDENASALWEYSRAGGSLIPVTRSEVPYRGW